MNCDILEYSKLFYKGVIKMPYTIKMPEYVNDFHCIGAACELDCCQSWDILWYKSEVDKLKSADCSAGLSELIDKSFEQAKNDKLFMITLGEDGDCPFHDKSDRLCMIQKELGEEYLSLTCRTFPQTGVINNKTVCKYRSLGCPAVYDLITASADACDIFVSANRPESFDERGYFTDKVDDVKKNPSLKHRNILFDFFYSILSDKKNDIKTSLILGGLAASKLSEFEKKSPARIPEVIKALAPQIKNPDIAKSLREIKPNYLIKLGVVQSLFDNLSVGKNLRELTSSLRDYKPDGTSSVNIERYIESAEKFYSCFEKDSFAIGNLVKSLYLDMRMPYNDRSDNIFANYAYFAVVTSSLEFLGAAAAAKSDDKQEIRQLFKSAVCAVARPLCHNMETKNVIIDYLKKAGCYSLAHIALIIN